MPDSAGSTGRENRDATSVALDLTGLKCPLPALRTRKALRALGPGTRLVVVATDPLAGLDIPNAVREEGGLIEARTRLPTGDDGVAGWRFTIRSAG